ncbi:MAG: ABC transporter permease subunit [Planctomycetes bacterium]|nr:ABC transporter permease subunit [Planctomycetota bacterium]
MPVFLRWMLDLIPTNPMVVRLVHGGSRRTRHLLIRSAYLGVLIIVLLILLLPGQSGAQSFRDLAVRGANAFAWVAYLQLLLICVLSPVFMAGAIAQESSPRTWDILLTTPLSSAQMVLGALFGRLFFILALLLCSLPLFAITQYFGGVPGRSVLMSYAVSGCAAMFVGAVAIALAVNRLAGKRAVFAFYAAVVTYLAVTAAIDAQVRPPSGGVTFMTALNPFLALYSLLSPSSYPRPDDIELASMGAVGRFMLGSPVGAWCLLSGGLSLLMIGVSATTVRQIGANVGGVPWYRSMFGLGAAGASERPIRHVGMNPIAWRESTARQATLGKAVARWGFVLVGVLWAVALVVYYHAGGMAPGVFRSTLLVTVWTELIVIMLVAINTSATSISREREDGTLDILLTTPITPKDYLSGKLRGLVQFLLPLLAVPSATVLLGAAYTLFASAAGAPAPGAPGAVVVSTMIPRSTVSVNAPLMLWEGALTFPIVAVAFVALGVMIGLHWSLKSKGTIASVVWAVGVFGSTAGVCGLLGWQAGSSIPFVGPVLAALNPVTLAFALTHPEEACARSVENDPSFLAARIALAGGAVIAAAVLLALVGALRSSMVRTFDFTTRKLAGNV